MADPPIALIDYALCKEFGWTITELNEQPYEELQKFIHIMNLRKTVNNNSNG